jgi:serine/threonine-protein kinase
VDRLKRRLEGDLDAIVMMSLRKESARRYGSADVMWEDVQRHLDGLPVAAHRATRWYRTRRFLGRHRAQAIGATVVTVSLVTAATVAVRQAAAARRERDRAEQAAGQAKEVTNFLVRLFRTPAPPGATRDQVTVKELLATGTARVEELGSQPVVQAQMLDALGRVNDQLGRFDDAEQMLRRALELRRARFGNDHADVALTLKNLASVLSQKDRSEEALSTYREALAIQQRVLGPSHPDVALSMIGVASLTHDKAVAESLYQAARDIQRVALGPDNLALATTDISLADIRRQRGAPEEAEALLRESLAIRTRRYGPEHNGTALSMVFLANLLRNYRNKPAEAESLYNHALVILRKEPASGLPMLIGALAGLVEIADERGEHAKAEVFAREIVDAQQRTWGVEHPVTTDGMEIVAEQVAAQGRYAEADAILTNVITILERRVGPQHFRFGSALIDRGWERLAAGRRAEAEADLRRALSIMEASEGPTSRYVGVTTALLGELTARRGGTAESAALFERAASILRPLPRQVSRDSRAAYSALADHYRAQRRTVDEEFFRRLAR